jgi:hypothetical protein
MTASPTWAVSWASPPAPTVPCISADFFPEDLVSRTTTYKTGLVLFIVLALSDLVSMAGLGSHDAPPAWVIVVGGLCGVITLAALPGAHRGNSPALQTARGSRVLSALLGIPAYFVADAPAWAPAFVTASLVLTAVGLALVRNSVRMPARSAV